MKDADINNHGMHKPSGPQENKFYVDCRNIIEFYSKIKDLGIVKDSMYTQVM